MNRTFAAPLESPRCSGLAHCPCHPGHDSWHSLIRRFASRAVSRAWHLAVESLDTRLAPSRSCHWRPTEPLEPVPLLEAISDLRASTKTGRTGKLFPITCRESLTLSTSRAILSSSEIYHHDLKVSKIRWHEGLSQLRCACQSFLCLNSRVVPTIPLETLFIAFERLRKYEIWFLYFCFTAMAEISIRALFTNAAA